MYYTEPGFFNQRHSSKCLSGFGRTTRPEFQIEKRDNCRAAKLRQNYGADREDFGARGVPVVHVTHSETGDRGFGSGRKEFRSAPTSSLKFHSSIKASE